MEKASIEEAAATRMDQDPNEFHDEYEYEKYETLNINGHQGPEKSQSAARSNQVATPIFQTQKVSLVEVEVSHIGQAAPMTARVEHSHEQLNQEVTRKNEAISEEICEAFVKISKVSIKINLRRDKKTNH